MLQFQKAKEAHPDALLFFRMGDFYELFFDDAVVAARALELTLTSRNKGAGDEIPMAGVPHHAASTYIQRLLDQGFKVAICEQMADPSKVKGIVPREVVRVVTPGLVYDDAGLDARQNHFLAAVERQGSRFGVAYLDLTTGELGACEADQEGAALAELLRLDPRELLVGPGSEAPAAALKAARPRVVLREATPGSEGGSSSASLDEADRVLEELLGAGEPVRSCPSEVARQAAGRCVAMAKASEAGRPVPVGRLMAYELGQTLVLDDRTQLHLELVRTLSGETKGCLLHEIDCTKTGPGARLLRRRLLSPRTDVAEIRRRHDAVELFVVHAQVRAEVRAQLDDVGDLERLAMKAALGRASPRDLGAVRRSLGALPALVSSVATCGEERLASALGGQSLDVMADVHRLLQGALADDLPLRLGDGPVLREGHDAELDELRGLTRDGQRYLVELEGRLREESQIPSLKMRFTRVFGWYLEVTRAHVAKAPASWRRKQTVATGERFTCDELDTLADKLAHAEERFAAREQELFVALRGQVAAHTQRLRATAAHLAALDVSSALAEVAHRYDYARPQVDDSLALELEAGRHPVVERLAAAGCFVPNDVSLDAGGEGDTARFWLVTGPNMAGKSTLMRQAALTVILAQMGSFVPAKRAHVGVVDRILTRVGASDNLAMGESTFMVEMKETANVLRRATRRSFVVLDEIGRGTSTYDGLAIAWAVAEHLHDEVRCRTVFATHYHELTDLAATRPGLANVSVSAREHDGEIVFLHKLQRGAASQSYGVACARLAGVPEGVLARARVLLRDLEDRSIKATHGERPDRRAPPQMDLFPAPALHPALAQLTEVDLDRVTPLEALQLLAQLQRLARA